MSYFPFGGAFPRPLPEELPVVDGQFPPGLEGVAGPLLPPFPLPLADLAIKPSLFHVHLSNSQTSGRKQCLAITY